MRRLRCAVAGLLAAWAVCGALYRFDNKYTAPGTQPVAGLLTLTNAELAQNPLRYLIREWEYYPGVLLTPEDFADGPPEGYRQFVSIGQYGGLEAGNAGRSPHGSAAYRLTLSLPFPARDYALELPAVYSACRLYVGGRQLLALGEVDPSQYRARVQERVVTFTGAGQVQLLLAVSDRTGIYSGLVYPPAFGDPQAVDRARQTRLLLREAGLLAAAGAGALALYQAARLRQRRALLFALLALAVAGYTSYPLVQTLFAVHPLLWNAAENGCLYAALCLMILLQYELCGIRGRAAALAAVCAGVFAVGAVVYSLIAPELGLGAMESFSTLSELAKLLTALVLFVSAARSVTEKPSGVLLASSAFFAASLLADRLLPLYEPIRGGWFAETGGAAMVCALGAVLWAEMAQAFHGRLVYIWERQQMQRQLAMQREHYRQLRSQIEETQRARHDLRQHLRTLRGLADEGDLRGIRTYLEGQSFVSPPESGRKDVFTYSSHYAADAVLNYYADAARGHGIAYSASLDLPEGAGLPDDELCILLGNLLENAVEACVRQTDGERYIRLRGDLSDGRLRLMVSNSAAAPPREQEGRFLSSKRSGPGMGVQSVRAIVERHGGIADFSSHGGAFRASILIPLKEQSKGEGQVYAHCGGR